MSERGERRCLGPLTTEATGQLDVLGLDGDALGVDGGQVGVLEESNKVGLRSLLQGADGRALEPQVSFEVLSDLPNQALEGKLADEQFSALLVSPDLTEGDSTRPIAMRLLDTAGGCGGGLSRCLGSELLARCLTTGGLAGSLLGTGHS